MCFLHFFSFQIASARVRYMCFHSYMCKDLAHSSQFTHTPTHARAAQAHLVPLFCRSLTPSSILFPLMHRMAPRLSLRPRPTVAPPPWSSSWLQARTRKKTTWCTFFPIFSFFNFEHFSQKKWKKNTRTSMAAAVTSLPRVCFPLLFVWKMSNFTIFFFQIASARAHYTCAFIATCAKTWPTPRSSHTPQAMLAPCRHPCSSLLPLTHSILHLLFPLMHRMATRLSFGPRATVAPPPWSSSWRQARTRRRRPM